MDTDSVDDDKPANMQHSLPSTRRSNDGKSHATKKTPIPAPLDANQRNETLRKNLAENPLDFDRHIVLLDSLKASGDHISLREARLNFSKLYPLPKTVWNDWVSDEIDNLSSHKCVPPLSIAEINQLYRNALNDYYCPKLRLKYCEFVLNHMLTSFEPAVVADCRQCFSAVLSELQYDVSSLPSIFAYFISFERTVLGDDDANSNNTFLKQLLQKQLTLPSSDLERSDLVAEYLAAAGEQSLPADLQAEYDAAKILYRKLAKYETRLQAASSTDADNSTSSTAKTNKKEKLFDVYRSYINFAINHNLEAERIVNIFERAVSDFPLVPDLWLSYLNYTDEAPAPSRRAELHIRTCKNCPGNLQLWKRQLRHAERHSSSLKELNEILDQGVLYGSHWFRHPEMLVDLCMEAVACGRRIYLKSFSSSSTQSNDQIEQTAVTLARELEQLFDKCDSLLAERNLDRYARLPQMFATIQAETFRNVVAFRSLMERALQRSARSSHVWLKYFMLERFLCAMGLSSLQIARQVLIRALKEKRMLPNDRRLIVDALLQFERESNYSCAEHVESEELCSEREFDATSSTVTEDFAESRERDHRRDRRTTNNKTNNFDAVDNNNDDDSSSSNKRARKIAAEDTTQQKRTAKRTTSAQSDELNEAEPRREKPPAAAAAATNSVKKKQTTTQSRESSISVVPVTLAAAGSGGAAAAASSISVQYSHGEERNKLFVKGIEPQCTRAELLAVFMPIGKFKDVRLLMKRKSTTQHRGVAYVEYEDDESALRALNATNGAKVHGKPLQVFISDPTKQAEVISEKMADVDISGGENNTLMSQTHSGMSRHKMSLVPANVQIMLNRTVAARTGAAQQSAPAKAVSSNNNDNAEKLPAAEKPRLNNEAFRKFL